MRGAILLDLDGTLFEGDRWIPGAAAVVRTLLDRGWQIRFVSNTTMRSRAQLLQRFAHTGLPIDAGWMFTPVRAAYEWLRTRSLQHGVLALVHPDLRPDLASIPLVQTPPADFVLVGDMGDTWHIAILNQALRALLQGARLIALQKNRLWKAPDGYRMDAGAFVVALEYASRRSCEMVFGKPNPVFFQMALRSIGDFTGPAWMVGDDLEKDILPAQRLGLRGVLIRRDPVLSHTDTGERPDFQIPSITALPDLLAAQA